MQRTCAEGSGRGEEPWFCLAGRRRRHRGGHVLELDRDAGIFADRIVEIEAVQGLPLAVYRLDGSLFVTSSVSIRKTQGFPQRSTPMY